MKASLITPSNSKSNFANIFHQHSYQSFLSTCGDEVYIFTPTVQLGPFCGFDDQFYVVRVYIYQHKALNICMIIFLHYRISNFDS